MTPYDSIFAREEFETDIFPRITADATEHAMDTWSVDAFLQLPATGALLEKLSPPGAGEASPITGVASLAFHGYHFWRGNRTTYAINEPGLRALLDPAYEPIGTWPLAGLVASAYVALPANLLWAQTDAGTPEAMHGFFYAIPPSPSDGRVDVLVALGVRPDRPAFTAIDLTVPLPAPAPGHFGDIQARESGDDFANILPGGELRGLFAVTNAGEVLKFVSRALHDLQRAMV